MKQQDGNTFSRFSLIRYPTDIEDQISTTLGYFINLIHGISFKSFKLVEYRENRIESPW